MFWCSRNIIFEQYFQISGFQIAPFYNLCRNVHSYFRILKFGNTESIFQNVNISYTLALTITNRKEIYKRDICDYVAADYNIFIFPNLYLFVEIFEKQT